MIKIKLTTPFPDFPLVRQTPKNSGIWEDCQFFINDDTADCDYWIVYEGLTKSETCTCPKKNIILITAEPPNVKKYDRKFTDQFSAIITCHNDIRHKNKILKYQAQPWLIGLEIENKQVGIKTIKNYDDFIKPFSENKNKIISVISSMKSFTKGHRERMEFVDKLKKHFGDQLDIYGKGRKEVKDKWDAVAPYKYSIVLENCSYKDYWTEKLSDVFLAETFPFYYGCPNIYDYFPKNALTTLDIKNPDKCIDDIENAISKGIYEKSKRELFRAKEMIINKYNLFNLISEHCRPINHNEKKEKFSLKAETRQKLISRTMSDLFKIFYG